MRASSQFRRIAKAFGLTVSITLLAAWIFSTSWRVGYEFGTRNERYSSFVIEDGGLRVMTASPVYIRLAPRGPSLDRSRTHWDWSFPSVMRSDIPGGSAIFLKIPLWL